MNLRDLLASYNSGILRARQEYALTAGNVCGTPNGRARHRREGTPVCPDCAESYNAHRRARYAAKKGAPK